MRKLIIIAVAADFANDEDCAAFTKVAKENVEEILKRESMDTVNQRNFEVEACISV